MSKKCTIKHIILYNDFNFVSVKRKYTTDRFSMTSALNMKRTLCVETCRCLTGNFNICIIVVSTTLHINMHHGYRSLCYWRSNLLRIIVLLKVAAERWAIIKTTIISSNTVFTKVLCTGSTDPQLL